MATVTKRPIQVYLRPDQLDKLRALAERDHVSVAELVRQGVDRLLASLTVEEDPLLDIIGLVEDGPEDFAANHDAHLAEMMVRDNR